MKKILTVIISVTGLLLLLTVMVGCDEATQEKQQTTPDVPETSAESTVEPKPVPDIPSSSEAVTPETPETPENQPGSSNGADAQMSASGEVVISFEYTRQTGPASNQHAVWIEDMDGNVIKTLFASRWTADGGFATRPDSIALWAERAGLADLSKTEVDAFSGATPRTGEQFYMWDLTDSNGETVSQGDYMIFIEGTLRWKNFVLFTGTVTIGDTPFTIHLDPEFHFEGSDRYAALTTTSVELNMIGTITVEFKP